MAGLLGAYEDSDEDDNAPSILAKAAQEDASAEKPSVAAPEEKPVDQTGTGEEHVCDENLAASGTCIVAASPLALDGEEGGHRSCSSSSGAASPHEEVNEGEVLIPPSPPGEPDPELVDRVMSLHALRKKGKKIRDHIQGSRDWSNPYILERVIKVFELDEHGSNYPKEVFDPKRIAEHPSDYYDAPECDRPPMPKRAKRGHDEGQRVGGRDARRKQVPKLVPMCAESNEGPSLVT